MCSILLGVLARLWYASISFPKPCHGKLLTRNDGKSLYRNLQELGGRIWPALHITFARNFMQTTIDFSFSSAVVYQGTHHSKITYSWLVVLGTNMAAEFTSPNLKLLIMKA